MPAEPNPFEARLREVFEDALAKPSTEERRRYLDGACADDLRLRSRVEQLLRAHERAGGFLGLNAHGDSIDLVTDASGTTIGPYRLIEKLGVGGFGIVYRAEQTEPVRRQVALKIIKLGMDTKEVIARFEAERQALALMEHPNIARVYDAGATDTGRPYFVMDMIEGEPITDYCDLRKLPVAQRLELFLQVCNAVQHAHSRGIVHRDLKPSNVVVVEENGKPLVKVIDFGIAKSMQGRLTDRTLITRREVLLGTPVYMSPEQLNLHADTVDTRSDVYSLGVLLYELIAGAPPFESDTLRKAAFAEVQRILREVEPEKPSTRFEHLGPKTVEIAQRRALEPPELRRLLRGDLDWVVMQALEKEPARRYATAAAFAEDLQRHLRREPVAAGPPSVAYRARKFAQRHRVTLAWAAAVVVLLTVWGLSSLRQARLAERAAERPREREAATRSASGQGGQPGADAGSEGLIQGIINVEDVAQLSPDETMLAYVNWNGPDADLWIRDLTTGQERNLTEGEKHAPSIYECCLEGGFIWSPDSQLIAYRWTSGKEDSLRIIPARGGEIRFLKPGNPDISFWPEDWSSDGRELLCLQWRSGEPRTRVLISVETGAIRQLNQLGSPKLGAVRLSPESGFVAFAGAEAGASSNTNENIYLFEVATHRTNQITFWPGAETRPIWAPNASVVLFSSDRLGSWDLWGVRIEDSRPVAPAFPVRYGVGNYDKRLTRSGKLIVHRKVAPGEGLTIAGPAASRPLEDSTLPGIIYFEVDDKLHTMTPDRANKKMEPPNVKGEPSWALHGGHRWFLQSRDIAGESYPSGHTRRELFAVRGDGDEAFSLQLTDDTNREPVQARWARDRESGVVDGVISWQASLWDEVTNNPPTAIFASRITFDAAGNVSGLESKPQAPLVNTGGSHDWSPSGNHLVYEHERQLFLLDLASGVSTALTSGGNPRWSPDGARIVFGHNYGICTIAVKGTDLRTLFEIPRYKEVSLSPPGLIGNACWSPDSTQLLYTYWKPGTAREINIYRIPVEGGEPVNLTAGVQPDFPVAWRATEPSTTQDKETNK